jgi:hypothetical protein
MGVRMCADPVGFLSLAVANALADPHGENLDQQVP